MVDNTVLSLTVYLYYDHLDCRDTSILSILYWYNNIQWYY